MRRPEPDEYAPFYAGYVDAVEEDDVLEALAAGPGRLERLLAPVTPELETFRYAPDRWTIREVVGHLIDSERLFGYRALHMARRDPAPLPSMDQEAWADASNAGERPLAGLLDELEAVRRGTLGLFRGLAPGDLDRRGVASGVEFTVRSFPWIVAGHEAHHRTVLAERYLPEVRAALEGEER